MKPTDILSLGQQAGLTWFDYQEKALRAAEAQPGPAQRRLLYYKTGAGKSVTSLGQLRLWGHNRAVVITPPSTYSQWQEWGDKLGVQVDCISHAKFRQKGYKLSRDVAVIADEFHLFGGNTGQGWKKLDRLAAGLQAPLILVSATPNYNDVERCYCIEHVMHPDQVRGGFLAYLYQRCVTMPDPFSETPKVTGFIHFKDAADYLSSLPNVDYLEDDLVYTIQDEEIPAHVPPAMADYGLNMRKKRIIASAIERKHAVVDHTLLTNPSTPEVYVRAWLEYELDNAQGSGPVLIFANHSTVARATEAWLATRGRRVTIVDGSVSTKMKQGRIDAFKVGLIDVLVGTASLATGTDGLDKVCDTLLILDDTDDDSLRRQLIGRIMPRGSSTNASKKVVKRLVIS
jgi:hypothetical protein